MIRGKKIIRKEKPVAQNCPFCKKGISPDFMEIEVLRVYTTERGKILGKDRTGLCTRHQSRVTTAIKRARYLALLPFSVQVR